MRDIITSRRRFISVFLGLIPGALLAGPEVLRAAKHETKDLMRQLEIEILQSSRPRKNPEIMCRISEDEFTLYRERGGKRNSLCKMNRTGNMIWEACNGNRSPKEISEFITHSYQVTEHQARIETLTFIDQLRQIGAITV